MGRVLSPAARAQPEPGGPPQVSRALGSSLEALWPRRLCVGPWNLQVPCFPGSRTGLQLGTWNGRGLAKDSSSLGVPGNAGGWRSRGCGGRRQQRVSAVLAGREPCLRNSCSRVGLGLCLPLAPSGQSATWLSAVPKNPDRVGHLRMPAAWLPQQSLRASRGRMHSRASWHLGSAAFRARAPGAQSFGHTLVLALPLASSPSPSPRRQQRLEARNLCGIASDRAA